MSHPSFTLPSPPTSPQTTSSRIHPENSLSSRRRQGRRRSSSASPSSVWQQKLGLDSSISKVNASAFFLHSAASITFLVFLNAVQPFLIAQLGVTEREGSLSGTLVFADESLSLILTLIWGSVADHFGTRVVASLSFCLVSLGLLAYTLASHAWPDLLYARLLFATGGSGVTTMLSAILASYSDPALEKKSPSSQLEGGVHENTSLLAGISTSTPASQEVTSEDSVTTTQASQTKSKSGRIAGLAGLFSGIGALFAVFSLLRLPVLFSRFHDGNPDLKDLHKSFWLVASLSLLVALLLALGLKGSDGCQKSERNEAVSTSSSSNYGSTSNNITDTPLDPTSREARRQRLRSRLPASRSSQFKSSAISLTKGTLSGFTLASQDSELVLAYLGGTLARAATIGTTVFVPLIVARFFYHSGKCLTLPPDDSSPDELKRICREAYSLASAISGVIQLFALLLAPLIGYLSDSISPVMTLGVTSFLGSIAFSILGVSLSGEGNGDPRSILAWISAVVAGICQIGAIVSSLVLIQRSKARAGEKAGGIAGAYSCTGGLSVLFTSRFGGFLFDMYSPSPFLLIAGISLVVTGASFIVGYRQTSR